MLRATLTSIVLFLSLVATIIASDITTFTDAKCTRSWRALDTVNGYPDGLCKPLNVTMGQSFQIQGLDPGCTVTLYGANAGPLSCSSATKTVGHLATCYDPSWVYYSIDQCLPPTPSSVKVSSVRPTSAGPSATKGASATPESKVHTGVIVGSVVAGISCAVLTLAGMLLVLRRRRKATPPRPTHELSGDRALAESDAAAERNCPKELWGGHAAVEIGRNSRFEDTSSSRSTKDAQTLQGVNPLIRIHYVR
ncbi:hypothetical protein ST47_g2103 [Ascochyta rabiei]|uniref:Uncharacterized protein n=1 Tax=Didymella rabiei TaxID=5454 RepID=A0A163K3V7_DIDRA|nr:hypothetical protein ST47_g2103 [Ascochyta rabiei]